MFSVPLGVRGPLRAPSGMPRAPPLGPPWPLLRPRRTTQHTVVISVRPASLFGQNGPGAREGCTFLEIWFFLVFSKIHPLPLGLPRPLLRPRPKRSLLEAASSNFLETTFSKQPLRSNLLEAASSKQPLRRSLFEAASSHTRRARWRRGEAFRLAIPGAPG